MNDQTHPTTLNFRLRPTLIIGLGGSGHRIVLQLKALLRQTYSTEQLDQNVRFLVLDTAQEELKIMVADQEISLEPGRELHDIGHTPVANIKRNLARQTAIAERLGEVITALPPAVLRNGAKQLRPLGLLAFLWRYADIESHLQQAIWSLAGRESSRGREGINVFIANSLVGGTGSSTFIDTAYVVRQLFDQLGNRADFCYITGVGLLPQAFPGVTGPNLIPNAVASLKELNHCMLRGGFQVRYPNGTTITTEQPPFNIYYLIDGIDERGHTWRGQAEVCRLAAQAIFLQMGSQIGQKSENDFDNLDQVLVGQSEAGDGTFYGSFGLAALHFPGRQVAGICAARLALQLIEQELLAPAPETDSPLLLQPAQLSPPHLAEQLASDDEGVPLTVDLTLPGWIERLAPPALPAELVRHIRRYEQTRLTVDFKRWLHHNEQRLTSQTITSLHRKLGQLARQDGLPLAEQALAQLSAQLQEITTALHRQQSETEPHLTALTQELEQVEAALLQAGHSHLLGRKGRVARAQQSYLATAEKLFAARWQNQLTGSALKILTQLDQAVQAHIATGQTITAALQAARRQLEADAAVDPGTADLTGVTTQSLAQPAVVARLFAHHAPPPAEIKPALFDDQHSPLDWNALEPSALVDLLRQACAAPFTPVAELTVEAALVWQPEQISPELYHAHLVAQATPSWNLDLTRLTDGGAAIERLAVLGVPDERLSCFNRQAAALVSTGDPTRITAFAAHVGLPHTALQHWDRYHLIYNQARGRQPLHIHPHFQTDSDFAQQTFALGTLFEFIKPTGAYFYYQPADPLDRPLKLAQGLANSLAAFTQQEPLVQTVRERVDRAIARQGLAVTLTMLEQYYQPEPDQTPVDELVLTLKRLVRNYAAELRQIHQFTPSGPPQNGRVTVSHPHPEANYDG